LTKSLRQIKVNRQDVVYVAPREVTPALQKVAKEEVIENIFF
jgi:hypothetical protein